MILLPLQELPLLIKEKVEFYYYRQLWLEKMEIMNHQYKKKVNISDMGGYTILFWWVDFIRGNNSIWDLEDRAPILFRQLHPKVNVYRFTTPGYDRRSLIPHNYFYSSGLNDPTGYK